MKRILDVSVSFTVLVLIWPLLLVLAVAVRLTSRGPVFFVQQRLGLNGKTIGIYKFRTMIPNAPPLINPDGSTYTGKDDPRLTKIGAILRSTSLDELPQFLNVLGGSMSLVGPRPDLPSQLEFYTEQEMRKLLVKPGITGLAQINGRNAIPWARRKELDVEYVERQSLWLDVVILAKTVPYVLLRKGVTA